MSFFCNFSLRTSNRNLLKKVLNVPHAVLFMRPWRKTQLFQRKYNTFLKLLILVYFEVDMSGNWFGIFKDLKTELWDIGIFRKTSILWNYKFKCILLQTSSFNKMQNRYLQYIHYVHNHLFEIYRFWTVETL